MLVSWVFLVEDEDRKKMIIIRNAGIKKLRRNNIFVLDFLLFFLCLREVVNFVILK